MRLRTWQRAVCTAVSVVAVLGAEASLAAGSAVAASPQWTLTSVSYPTNFTPGDETGDLSYKVTLTNTGTSPSDGTPIKVTDELPAGLGLDPSGGSGNNPLDENAPTAGFSCNLNTCTYSGAVVPDQTIEFRFPVDVSASAPSSLTNVIRVSGGGALGASVDTPTAITTEAPAFGISPGGAATALSTLQAGAHPDLTTAISFNTRADGSLAGGDPKDTIDNLPPGFAGDLVDAESCSSATFLSFAGNVKPGKLGCPVPTQVGLVTVTLIGPNAHGPQIVPLYNLTPGPGSIAKLGFIAVGFTFEGEVFLRPRDYGLRTAFFNATEGSVEVEKVALTIWGEPAAATHDPLRWNGESNGGTGHFGQESAAARVPFFTNPTACGSVPLEAQFSVNSWQSPQENVSASMPFGPIVGCDRLGIEPEITVQPTSTSSESPTGLDVNLKSDQQYLNPEGLVSSELDSAKVTLPEGMSLNPSAGSGLGSCSEAQFEYEGSTYEPTPGLGCPENSKIGSVRVHSPALAEEASGSLYVATPTANPFHSLLALYLVARIPNRGVVVTVPGHVEANPLTGQLVTTFAENPQVPFDEFVLAFRQGATSPLVTPPTCGSFSTAALLTPWSVPSQEHPLSWPFQITAGVGGGACPSGGVPPFHPGLIAGTQNNAAGSYSPFYVRLSRNDGEQEFTHFSIKLPPGVLANLSGVAKCSDAQIAQAKSREHTQGGAEEEASPSCPAASEVGHTLVEAGVGTVLAQAPGRLYLAGPYHGAPISLVSITAAKVGPFDLGTVVVRFALKIDPETTEVSVDGQGSDPIPHIIDGIPVHARVIRSYVDRNHFALNPTSCKPTSTASTVVGSGKDFVSSADDQPVTVTSPFQAANCASLGFRPTLKLALKGGKTHRGGLPGLKATLTARPGDANIGKAQVTLPPSEFLEQGHLKDVCPRSVWTQGTVPGEKCPANSIYGHARATTPLLSEPLEGPVYLRTGYGTRLPELVAALNAQEINVDVVGEIDSVHQKGSEVSLLRNTFKTVPDAPVSKFTLELKGGKKGLLVNSTDICKGTHKALAAFTGQNGKLSETEPNVEATSCKGTKKGKGKKKGHGPKKAGKGATKGKGH